MSRGGNVAADRRERAKQASKTEREACARLYAEHCQACASNGVAPAAFEAFFAEWLETSRLDDGAPGSGDAYEGHRRSYERMFEGKRGWD